MNTDKIGFASSNMNTPSIIKSSLSFFLSVCIFCSCLHRNNEPDNSLKITLHNTTGYRIDSTTIAGKYIGTIESGASVFVEKGDSICMQAGNPFGCLDGKIENKKRGDCFELCGTGVTDVTSGSFDFDIFFHEYDDKFVLRLIHHKNTR